MTSTTATAATAGLGTAPKDALPLAGGALGMTFVGGAVAVSGVLHGAPAMTAQSLRYAVAAALLAVYARFAGTRLLRPRGVEWLWLAGVVGTGMVLFNVALVEGSAHAEPAVLAVAVAGVPVVLAVLAPVLEGRRPRAVVLQGALIVTAGAALVQGVGRTDGTGLLWAVVVLACEAGFTLLAVPLLGRHGPVGVSVHACWLAATAFAVLGAVGEGPAAVLELDGGDLAATAYLAVCVTALAFVLWYGCVSRLGAGRSGLLTGLAPVAAAAVGAALAGVLPGPMVWVGIAVVAAGLTLGLRPKMRAGDFEDGARGGS